MTDAQTKIVETYKKFVALITPAHVQSEDPQFAEEVRAELIKVGDKWVDMLSTEMKDGVNFMAQELFDAMVKETPSHLYHFLFGGLANIVGQMLNLL